jgi:CMP/dCMP kinase
MTVIAIDGPAGAGKGTLALSLSKALGFTHLDSGLLYRAVAARWLDGGGNPESYVTTLSLDMLYQQNLRTTEVSRASSIVAANPAVRLGLLAWQRAIAHQGNVVIDGRDIGTIVCPDAIVKIFLTASVQERATRRWMEQGKVETFENIVQEITMRDNRDYTRETAPLKPAMDCYILDSTHKTQEDVLTEALQYVTSRLHL